jgi:UDP-glucose 4-epimerase
MQGRTALITGIAGGLAQLVGAQLRQRGFGIIGVDYRPLAQPLDYEATIYQANYNKTRIEDIFRRHCPSHVLHLGRVGNLKIKMGKRFDLNVVGSTKLMELSLRYGAKRMLVLSTFHIYGAHASNHTPIHEEEPLRAGTEFPEIGDAVQLDNQAVIWIYRHPEVQTVLLRPCNVIGPDLQNAMSRFLRQPVIPVLMGFDPMVQFVFQSDLVSAILAATESDAVGVFNVAGHHPIPAQLAIDLTGAPQLPILSSIARLYLKVTGTFKSALPSYMVNFFKYPCIISDTSFRKTFNWAPTVDARQAVWRTVGKA